MENPKYQGFVLKVFPSAQDKQILGFYAHSVTWQDYYFLEYINGKMINASGSVPQYSQGNIYEFPRVGTKIKVYKKKFSSPAKQINADQTVTRGRYLYSLNWAGGKVVAAK